MYLYTPPELMHTVHTLEKKGSAWSSIFTRPDMLHICLNNGRPVFKNK